MKLSARKFPNNLVSCNSVKHFHFQETLGNIKLALLKYKNACLGFGNSHENKHDNISKCIYIYIYICVCV